MTENLARQGRFGRWYVRAKTIEHPLPLRLLIGGFLVVCLSSVGAALALLVHMTAQSLGIDPAVVAVGAGIALGQMAAVIVLLNWQVWTACAALYALEGRTRSNH